MRGPEEAICPQQEGRSIVGGHPPEAGGAVLRKDHQALPTENSYVEGARRQGHCPEVGHPSSLRDPGLHQPQIGPPSLTLSLSIHHGFAFGFFQEELPPRGLSFSSQNKQKRQGSGGIIFCFDN